MSADGSFEPGAKDEQPTTITTEPAFVTQQHEAYPTAASSADAATPASKRKAPPQPEPLEPAIRPKRVRTAISTRCCFCAQLKPSDPRRRPASQPELWKACWYRAFSGHVDFLFSREHTKPAINQPSVALGICGTHHRKREQSAKGVSFDWEAFSAAVTATGLVERKAEVEAFCLANDAAWRKSEEHKSDAEKDPIYPPDHEPLAPGRFELTSDETAKIEAEFKKAKNAPFSVIVEVSTRAPGCEQSRKRHCADDALYSARRALWQKFNISGADLLTLRDGKWLNDSVINFYFRLLNDRQQQLDSGVNDGHKSVYFCDPQMYTSLMQVNPGVKNPGVKNPAVKNPAVKNPEVKNPDDKVFCFESVCRWGAKDQIDFSKVEKIIVPIHVNENHWCLAVIHVRSRHLDYFDSLGNESSQHAEESSKRLHHLAWYFDHQLKRDHPDLVISNCKQLSLDSWPKTDRADIPRQKNGFDCGVFTLMYADYTSRNRSFDFTQADMHSIRRKIALQICAGEL